MNITIGKLTFKNVTEVPEIDNEEVFEIKKYSPLAFSETRNEVAVDMKTGKCYDISQCTNWGELKARVYAR